MSENTVTSVREITVEGEKFECRCYDPYGFWRVKYQGKGGPQPKEIDGNWFTSLTECEKAVIAIATKKTKKDSKDMAISVVNPLQDKE